MAAMETSSAALIDHTIFEITAYQQTEILTRGA